MFDSLVRIETSAAPDRTAYRYSWGDFGLLYSSNLFGISTFEFRIFQKIMTVLPTLTRSLSRMTSQLATRMQPWLAARPIGCGLFVPWMPMPGLFKLIQTTPTRLFGPGGRL